MRAPALGAVLGDPARLQRRRDRRRPGPHGPAVERVAHRLGLRHQRAAAGRRRGRPPPRSCAAWSACPTWRSRSPAPRCGATTRCTPPTCSRAGCSAPATRSTGTRRATGWGPTPRSRTPTTWPGSWPRCCEGRRPRRCWRPTRPSGRRSPSRSCSARTSPAGSSVEFFDALGMTEAGPEAEMVAPDRGAQGQHARGAAKRAALVKAMELKNYEFNAHGVEMGQFYAFDRGGLRRVGAAFARAGSGAVLPAVDRARGPAAARLGRGQHRASCPPSTWPRTPGSR